MSHPSGGSRATAPTATALHRCSSASSTSSAQMPPRRALEPKKKLCPSPSFPREHRSFFYFLPVKEAASIMLVYLPIGTNTAHKERKAKQAGEGLDARALLAPFSHRPVCSYVPQYRSTRRARPTHVQRGRERKESTCGGRSVRRPPMDCNGCGIERMAHTG